MSIQEEDGSPRVSPQRDMLSTTVRNMMENRGLRQNQLARMTKLSAAYVCDLLSGRRRIGPGVLNKMLDALSVPINIRRLLHEQGAKEAGWKI